MTDKTQYGMPEKVTFPTELDVERYWIGYGSEVVPVCPVAYFAVDCGQQAGSDCHLFRVDPRYRRLRAAITTIIKFVTFTPNLNGFVGFGDDPSLVEHCNNRIPDSDTRVLVYCAALAALGYVDGNREDSIELARKAGFAV